MLEEYLNITTIPAHEIVIRTLLAAAFGLIIGVERDQKRKPIDFRALVIICVTSCTICMLGSELVLQHQETDIGKIIEGVMTGIGFLGAGAILKMDDHRVVGTATGASVWASGGMGVLLGFGYYGLAAILFIVIFLTLYVGGYFSKKYFDRE